MNRRPSGERERRRIGRRDKEQNVPEQGTPRVRALTTPSAGNTIIVARMAQTEVMSGVWRLSYLLPRTSDYLRPHPQKV